MSFLQLVFSLDKTFEGNNSILENLSILTDIATVTTDSGDGRVIILAHRFTFNNGFTLNSDIGEYILMGIIFQYIG